MKYQIFFIPFIFLFSLSSLLGQQDTLPSDELQVIKDFDAQLEDVDKIDLYPPLPAIDTQRQVQYYSVEPKLLDLEYDAPSIQPIMQKTESQPDSYKGFIRTGISYPLGGVLEGGYEYLQDRFLIGGLGKFQGMFNNWQRENQDYWESSAKINSEYFFDQGFSLGGDIGYSYENRLYFGYDPETISFDKKNIQQYFSIFDIGLDFKNNTVTYGDLDYAIEGDFYSMGDNSIADEKGINGMARMSKYFNKKHELEIKINDNYIINNSDSIAYKKNILSLIPSFTYHHSKFRIKGGVNASMIDTDFHFFPNAEILANIYKNNVSVYAGWDGEAEQHTFRNLSERNPFVISNPELRVKKINYPHAGLKFDFKKIKIGFEAGYKIVKDQILFVNDFSNDEKKFIPVYEDMQYIVSEIVVGSTPVEHFNIDIGLRFQNPKTDSLSNNYHDQPNIHLESEWAYSGLMEEHLTLGARMHAGSAISAINNLGVDTALKGFFDLGIFGKYNINENFHLFLDLNNITHQKYQRWNGYPNVGFNTTFGLFYRFK